MRTNAAVVTGLLGGVAIEMMLDSGSVVSLVRKDMMSPQMINVAQIPLPAVKLVTAAGDDLLMVDHIQTTVQIQHHTVTHMFVVVNTLITPVILGMDFLQKHGMVIDFASTPVRISLPPAAENNTDPILRPVLQAEHNLWTKYCAIWGEPERAPHIRDVCKFCLSVCLSIGPYVHDTTIYKCYSNLRIPSIIDCSLEQYVSQTVL